MGGSSTAGLALKIPLPPALGIRPPIFSRPPCLFAHPWYLSRVHKVKGLAPIQLSSPGGWSGHPQRFSRGPFLRIPGGDLSSKQKNHLYDVRGRKRTRVREVRGYK